MRQVIWAFIAVSVVLGGCQQRPTVVKQAQVDESEEEPTPEEIVKQIRRGLRPVQAFQGSEAEIPPQVKNQKGKEG